MPSPGMENPGCCLCPSFLCGSVVPEMKLIMLNEHCNGEPFDKLHGST